MENKFQQATRGLINLKTIQGNINFFVYTNWNTFARMYRGLVDIRLTISTNAELTLKLISRLSQAAGNLRKKTIRKGLLNLYSWKLWRSWGIFFPFHICYYLSTYFQKSAVDLILTMNMERSGCCTRFGIRVCSRRSRHVTRFCS